MLAFAKHEFSLLATQKDGKTLREHFAAVERITGKRPPEMDGPALPECAAYLFSWFVELNQGRTHSVTGQKNPITWNDMLAWATLTRREIETWEASAIRALDNAYLTKH